MRAINLIPVILLTAFSASADDSNLSKKLLSCWHSSTRMITSSTKKVASDYDVQKMILESKVKCLSEKSEYSVSYEAIKTFESDIIFSGKLSFVTSREYHIKYDTKVNVRCFPSLGPGSERPDAEYEIQYNHIITYDNFYSEANKACYGYTNDAYHE